MTTRRTLLHTTYHAHPHSLHALHTRTPLSSSQTHHATTTLSPLSRIGMLMPFRGFELWILGVDTPASILMVDSVSSRSLVDWPSTCSTLLFHFIGIWHSLASLSLHLLCLPLLSLSLSFGARYGSRTRSSIGSKGVRCKSDALSLSS